MIPIALLSIGLLFSQPLIPDIGYNAKELIEIHQNILPYKEYINKYSEQYNIDKSLVIAVIHIESRGNSEAVSYAGAQGLMQIMPCTGKFLGLKNAFNPGDNIHKGIMYLAMLSKQYDNNEYNMLWAWNAGMKRVNDNIMPDETEKFIYKVLTLRMQL